MKYLTTLLSCIGMCAVAAPGNTDYTRGIGRYPGAQSEYYAPAVSWVDNGQTLSNVALHRAAWASSSIDYNHTAHLVTDGICNTAPPVRLKVSTQDGVLPRKEAEWAIDGGAYSKNILMGEKAWLQYDYSGAMKVKTAGVRVVGMMAYNDQLATKGYSIRCEASENGKDWQVVGEIKGSQLPGKPLLYKLHSDPNKQTEESLLPARQLDELIKFKTPVNTQHLRVVMDMAGAAHWDVYELNFQDAIGGYVELLPSQKFSSVWMSDGGGKQWLYTDLGKSLPIRQIELDWLYAPKVGIIQVSDDAKTWRKVADFKAQKSKFTFQATARYVRLLLQEPGEAGCYALREMAVLSKFRKIYAPHALAGLKNGRYELSGGLWQLQRASEVDARGEQIASADYDSRSWIPATVPGTVLASFMNIGAVPDPNYADDVDQISESYFRSNFWYRQEFDITSVDGAQQWLNFDGINWKANVYLNGQRLGRIEGAFMRGKFNVTGLLRKGKNYLAVEVECNQYFGAVKEKDRNTTQLNGGLLGADNPTFHATIGWDWITTVRGREVGIWNEVYLTSTGNVTVSDPYVSTKLSADGRTASVKPSVFVRNNDNQPVKGTLKGWIGDVKFEKQITLPANTEQEVSFCPHCNKQLTSSNFKLWWPNGYGEPYLYESGFTFEPDHGEASTISYQAGIREMKYEGLKDSLIMYINGRRFIPLGGNWGFDEHNLLYRSREYDIAVGYHKQMNCTMIRNWVGQIGDEAFYEACDKHGIMIWQDFWLANPADGPDPYDDVLFLSNAQDYLRRIRSHASIGIWVGRNEGFPPETIDRKLREYVHTFAPGLEFISSSADDGVSGHGPYWALPMKEYFARQSGKIHSERGMPNVMNIESLTRTLSPDALWPQSVQWGQHDYTLMGAQRAREFNGLVEMGLGKASSAEEFTRWAQLINYNGYRGMYESTSKSRAGLLIWMSHACWPSMVWQTYDYYFDPTAAYFGVKKACEPLHIQYNALTDSIEVVNHSAGNVAGITATVAVYDLNGKKVRQQKLRLNSNEDTTQAILRLTKLQPQTPSAVWFLRLSLTDKRGVISENEYIMGREENNYRALTTLPKSALQQNVKVTGTKAVLTLKNTGKTVAPFLRVNLKGADGEQILPVIYSDNYFTLMPGEQKIVTIEWKAEDARGQAPVFEVTPIS
ncbi:discoidin domain-containing protein [Prevotella sp. P6B1]|uniref:glycosyl hydrolase 2 galactose-binding domain-containing protein n=1 Tax=Prevotella sp. P6B1 TaxID=1410613 RepID=UPI00068A6052|nr:discoidin domain-containing protein [Prevotella sp. P6B1]